MSRSHNYHIHHNSVLFPLINSLQEDGRDLEQLMSKSNLNSFNILKDNGYLPSSVVYDFFELAHKKYDLQQFSEFCKNYNGVNSWGEMGAFVLSMPTLFDVVAQSVKFESNFHTNAKTQFRIDGPIASLTFRYLDRPTAGRRLIEELIFAASLDEFQHIMGDKWVPLSLSVKNSDLREIENVLPKGNYDLLLNQDCYSISFASSFLAEILQNNTGQDQITEPLLLDGTTLTTIDRTLLNLKDGDIPKLSDLSGFFNVNERSLERHLLEYGTSFRQLREKSLFLRSLQKLEDQNKTLKDISLELGYTESANFSRAFKRWTGSSPQEYRLKL